MLKYQRLLKKNKEALFMGKISQFIIFKLEEEEFGVKITDVQEIKERRPITKLPRAASFIEGIINIRGDIITIIDLRKRLGFKAENSPDDRILIVKLNDIDVGFIVDDASQVLRIDEDQISSPSKGIAGLSTEFIGGVAKMEDRLIILLALDQLLTSTEKVHLEEILETEEL